MNEPHIRSQRLEELLSDQALFGLTLEQQDELKRLLATSPIDPESFDRIAAIVSLALPQDSNEPMPRNLEQKILNSFDASVSAAAITSSVPSTASLRPSETEVEVDNQSRYAWRRREMIAWLIAAASLSSVLIDRLIILWTSRFQHSLAESRALMLQSEPHLIQANCRTTDDPSARGVTGDVIWSNKVQRGFLRVNGLAKNEPFVHQYQLWIFDAEQDEKYPIDGGVFDIDKSKSDVVVQINPRLPVVKPTMFAVTIEKRGGVVVSKRERLLLFAEPVVKPV